MTNSRKNHQGFINTSISMLWWWFRGKRLALSGGQVEWPAQGQRPWIASTPGRTGRRSVRPGDRHPCRYGPWRGPLTETNATQSNHLMLALLALFEAQSGSCSLSPGHTRSFDLCALGLRIVKAAGLVQAFSLLNLPRRPLIIND